MGFVGKEYNPLIWSDMTMDEKKTYQIYEEFQKAYNKLIYERGFPMRQWLPSACKKTVHTYEVDGKYPADEIREHKNWKIFSAIYDKYKDESTFDPAIFVKGAFYYRDIKKQIYPSMLITQEAETSYHNYIEKIITEARMGGTGEEVLQALKGTRMAIWKLLQMNNTDEPDYQKIYGLFNNIPEGHIVSQGIIFSMNGMLSPYYLAISRSFRAAYKTLDQDVKSEIGFDAEEDMEPYVGVVHQFTNTYRAAKVLFGEDII